MPADQDVAAAIQGVEQDANGNPTQTPVGSTPAAPGGYRATAVRARSVIGNVLKKVAFSWPFNGGSAATTSVLDMIEGTAEQIAVRYIDADGIVWDPKAFWHVQIEHFKDGLPPLTPELIAQYWVNATKLRAWPTTDVITGQPYTGAFPGEATQTYPSYPPAASS
jgi:hypothetical protein